MHIYIKNKIYHYSRQIIHSIYCIHRTPLISAKNKTKTKNKLSDVKCLGTGEHYITITYFLKEQIPFNILSFSYQCINYTISIIIILLSFVVTRRSQQDKLVKSFRLEIHMSDVKCLGTGEHYITITYFLKEQIPFNILSFSYQCINYTISIIIILLSFVVTRRSQQDKLVKSFRLEIHMPRVQPECLAQRVGRQVSR